ncbi:ribonuclease Y [Entomoplasma freundtii]|uniref:Ribonuclease Y n=1 Tax=Entomoplasma freundtii TaxID=74700 RepID=A0A2K8NRG8_9MOLU|nr:ribonuclease Y [Entomoplasma freundtii]ATZ16430.1 ribonuclease Y [Entomoplasma freundtii]TDY56531.1 ribonuclease Y [Entomoplasma freundtii]
MLKNIFLIILGVAVLLLGLLSIWLAFAKSRRQLVKKAEKEAKQLKKQIVTKGYREVNELKLEFDHECDKRTHKLNLEKEKLHNEESALAKKERFLEMRQERLDGYELALEKRSKEYEKKTSKMISLLESISGMSREEARKNLMKQMELRHKKELNSYLKNAELETHAQAKEMATNIIVNAMERYATEIVNEKTTNIVKLPNDEIKGRVIGREGRNMRTFEQFGGVDILIDETPGIVTVSSFNPIRREITTKALEKLVADGRIQPARIEAELKKQEKEIESIIFETGQKALQELGILDMEIPLVKLVGRLKYRTSYGQNALHHSLEVAKISGAIASELGLDIQTAIRAGLLHDIGKAVDFEEEGSHVTLGAELARQYNEDDIVINAIEAHHEDVAKQSTIAAVVAIADSISASRPGARNNTSDDFYRRMTQIEKIAQEIPGVEKIYAFQSGRQIRVIVDPNMMGEHELENLIEEVKHKLLENIIIPGEITITIIRERRLVKVIKK